VPLDPSVAGTSIPDAAGHLDFLPARALALVGNVAGTVAAVGVALTGIRRRPLGNTLVIAGVAAAAIGSAVAGLGAGGGAVFTLVAALLLYAGFVSRR
jgi:Flp pilus assembly protein protease CpaA